MRVVLVIATAACLGVAIFRAVTGHVPLVSGGLTVLLALLTWAWPHGGEWK